MRKLLVCALLVLVLIVAINVWRRTGGPSFDLENISPWFGRHEDFAVAVAAFLKPGTYALWYIGFTPNKSWQLIAAAMLSWWAWLTGARVAWCIVGRAFGIVNMANFHWWLRLALPWRAPFRLWLRLKAWYRQFRFGSGATATWASALAAMLLTFKRGDSVCIGRLRAFGIGLFQLLGMRGTKHVTVIAATGSGKTRWITLDLGMLHKKASAFVVDCAGQVVNTLGAALERNGHRVLNLDPYGLSRFPRACWNPIHELDCAAKRHGRQSVVRFAMTLAQGLIVEDNSHQPIFSTAARTFIHGACLFVWRYEPTARRNLVRVRELLTRGLPDRVLDPKEDPFAALLRVMIESERDDDGCDGQISAVIARGAAVMQSGQRAKEGNPFRSTALAQLAWLDLPEITALCRRSDFACEDLKTSNPCVFVVAPVMDIQTKLAGFVRVLTMMMMTSFENIPGRMKIPCAVYLDEMPSLRIPALDTAAPTVRKHGMRLIVIAQDIEILRQAYPHSYGGFIGNSMCTIFMGTEHIETLELIAKLLGTQTIVKVVEGGWLSKVPKRIERREHPLLDPQQAKELLDPERGLMIVIRAGKSPLRVVFEPAERALPVWAYEQDPDYRERFLRAQTRKALAYLWLRKPPKGPAISEPLLKEKFTNGTHHHV